MCCGRPSVSGKQLSASGQVSCASCSPRTPTRCLYCPPRGPSRGGSGSGGMLPVRGLAETDEDGSERCSPSVRGDASLCICTMSDDELEVGDREPANLAWSMPSSGLRMLSRRDMSWVVGEFRSRLWVAVSYLWVQHGPHVRRLRDRTLKPLGSYYCLPNRDPPPDRIGRFF